MPSQLEPNRYRWPSLKIGAPSCSCPGRPVRFVNTFVLPLRVLVAGSYSTRPKRSGVSTDVMQTSEYATSRRLVPGTAVAPVGHDAGIVPRPSLSQGVPSGFLRPD